MNLINRDNYQDVLGFLEFQSVVKQVDPRTAKAYWSCLRHLLEWAQDKRLSEADKIKPTFPAYVQSLKTVRGKPFGAAAFAAICKVSRAFFTWARDENPRGYKTANRNWVVSIRPPRARSEQSELKSREIYTLDEVIKLATYQTDNLTMRRSRAAAAFLFLSGMRIQAFVSLPINCVDLKSFRVHQLPEKGVLTKNNKAAITTLLDIPELIKVVKEWDDLVRSYFGQNGLWYANFNRQGELTASLPDEKAIRFRQYDYRSYLQRLCNSAGVVYKSPHKFRHGHAVYALQHAKSVEQLKAISQNLMHSTIGITDGIYGRLVEDNVHDVIRNLTGGDNSQKADTGGLDLEAVTRAVIAALREEEMRG